jgi:hypothetical protein
VADPLCLGLPLDAHQVRRLDRLRELAGEAYGGWGQDVAGEWFVDVAGQRFYGPSLHGAIGEATRATARRLGLPEAA